MKNESLFPLERNNYFFGKLMTEREFDMEQVYVNNKRRLLNLSLFSPGVVCGLTVTRVDGATVAIESGLAIDGLGREIAVPELVVTLLSELDGFNEDRGHMGYVYLCAEYAEEQKEPMRALGGGSGGEMHGTVRETVRLFLRYGEPEPFETKRLDTANSRVESMENKLERRARVLIYLARIHLVRWEEAYEIDKIDRLPFDQYAMSQTMPEISAEAAATAVQNDDAVFHAAETAPPAVSYGTAQVEISEGAKPGSVYYSDDIPHGLGLVPAAVTLGISNIDGAVFGDASVFDEQQGYTFAAKVSDGDGTFKIGVRVNGKLSERSIRFVWSAVCDPARAAFDTAQAPRIILDPGVARIKPLQITRFSATRYGLPDDDIVWSVREQNGGEITADGIYLAPFNPGVYTITASCGSVMASAYVVVS